MHDKNQYILWALPKLLVGMAGVYTLQSLIGGLMVSGLSTYLRDQGLRLDLIGLLSLLMLPWVIKFSWSALIERWRLQKATTTRSSLIILIGQLLMIILLVVISFIDPVVTFALLLGLLGLLAMLGSTIDIVADGFMIERLLPQHRGWGNVVQIAGGYTGVVIGGGVFLILVENFGWTFAINSIALGCCGLALMFFFSANLPLPKTNHNGLAPSLWSALKRKKVLLGLSVIVISQLGLRLTIGLSGPFLVDKGLSIGEIGVIASTYGLACNLLAIFFTGLAIKTWGAKNVLYGILIMQVVLFLSFTVAALDDVPVLALKYLFVGSSTILAAAFVALYTLMTDWVSQHQPGVDFTLFQSMDMLVGVIAGTTTGVLAENFGYQASFGFATVAAIFALFSFPFLLRIINRGTNGIS